MLARMWKKSFTNPTSDRGLIPKIYKELKKLDSRKPNNHIKKWGAELKNPQLRNLEWLRLKEMFNILSH